MVIFGGTSETGQIHQDMYSFNFEDQTWIKIKFTSPTVKYFTKGAACAVIQKKNYDTTNVRKVSLDRYCNFCLERFNTGGYLLFWRQIRIQCIE